MNALYGAQLRSREQIERRTGPCQVRRQGPKVGAFSSLVALASAQLRCNPTPRSWLAATTPDPSDIGPARLNNLTSLTAKAETSGAPKRDSPPFHLPTATPLRRIRDFDNTIAASPALTLITTDKPNTGYYACKLSSAARHGQACRSTHLAPPHGDANHLSNLYQ